MDARIVPVDRPSPAAVNGAVGCPASAPGCPIMSSHPAPLAAGAASPGRHLARRLVQVGEGRARGFANRSGRGVPGPAGSLAVEGAAPTHRPWRSRGPSFSWRCGARAKGEVVRARGSQLEVLFLWSRFFFFTSRERAHTVFIRFCSRCGGQTTAVFSDGRRLIYVRTPPMRV
jgi:hypothetical protein